MLFDMHVHTSESSPCAAFPAKELVNAYKEKGFYGIVITDHFSRMYMEGSGSLSHEDYCKYSLEGFLKAKDEGECIGLTVLYGCELKLDCTGNNDYLIYGLSNDFLVDNPDILRWTVRGLKQQCEENGFVFYQAHPFRDNIRIVSPIDLFGIEVFNGGQGYDHPWEDQRNDIANLWADKYGLRKIAGSDCHDKEHVGVAGVKFLSEIHDNKELVDALINNKYYLVERALHTV